MPIPAAGGIDIPSAVGIKRNAVAVGLRKESPKGYGKCGLGFLLVSILAATASPIPLSNPSAEINNHVDGTLASDPSLLGQHIGRGRWIDGDADTEIVFEVTSDYRDGDAFVAASFAESFSRCAEDVCRAIVIDDFMDEPFTDWDLVQDKSRWNDLPSSYL